MPYLVDFSGSIGRLEFLFVNILASIIGGIALLVQTAFLSAGGPIGIAGAFIATGIGLLGVPIGLSAWVRRLHDLEWSGWLAILAFVPLVGIVMFLILLFKGPPEGEAVYGAMHSERRPTRW